MRSGIQEVWKLKQRLDATFERIDEIDSVAIEVQSDFAKYLCVLVSGFLERSIVELVQEHARRKGPLTLSNFVENRTKRFPNPKPDKIRQLLGSFDSRWHLEVDEFLRNEVQDAINSIVSNRHLIAHGYRSDITVNEVRRHYQVIQKLVKKVQSVCLDTG